MPGYFNPYNMLYPASYAGAPQMWQQPMASVPQQTPMFSMCWVGSEMEAQGRQMPQGVTQLAMWDSTKPVIYLKSINQMGMPNPMQKLHYTVEAEANALPAASESVNVSEQAATDMSQYVTKQDLNQLKNEIRSMLNDKPKQSSETNQNGSYSKQNRGGNN